MPPGASLATTDLYYHLLAIIVRARLCVERALAEGPPVQVAAATEQEALEAGAGEAVSAARSATDAQNAPSGHKLGGASGYLMQRR